MTRILELIVIAYFAIALTVLSIPVGIAYFVFWVADAIDGMWASWKSR